MEILMVVLVGALVAVGCYLLMDTQLLRIILGVSVFSQAINLMFFLSSKTQSEVPPLIMESRQHLEGLTADALPQALILTAIVIGFAMLAFFVVLIQRVYQYYQEDNFSKLKESDQ